MIAAIFFQCSNSVSVGGGTGTETVNTFAMQPDGRPAAGATARIIDARWWFDSISKGASPVLGETRADTNGFIHLTYPEHQGAVNLQIDHTEEGLLVSLPTGSNKNSDTVHLKPYASVAGSIKSITAASATSIALVGTTYRQAVMNSGDFLFEKVAPGSYALLCLAETPSSVAEVGGTTLTLNAGDITDSLSVTIHANRVLLDNFESGVGPTSLSRIFPVLGWYVLSDSLYYLWDTALRSWREGKTVRIGQSSISFDTVPDGNGGKAFNVKTKLDPVSPYANALFGFSCIPLSERGIDLTAMSGFSFRASGNGIVQIRFETHDLDSATSLQSCYSYFFKLQPTMSEYSIPVDSLRMYVPSIYAPAHPWTHEAKRVMRIEFEFTAAVNVRGTALHMTLDDFYLNGISLASLHSGQ